MNAKADVDAFLDETAGEWKGKRKGAVTFELADADAGKSLLKRLSKLRPFSML